MKYPHLTEGQVLGTALLLGMSIFPLMVIFFGLAAIFGECS